MIGRGKKREGELPEELTSSQREKLIILARDAIRSAANGEPLSTPVVSDQAFKRPSGVFVTLTETVGDLRGCIGYIKPDYPLVQAVVYAAEAAALRDPRFPPVSPGEVNGLKISISILHPTRVIRDISEIIPGRDGLIVRKGLRQGLLLPQVANRHGWGVERFLEETCAKAGLSRSEWRDPGTVIEAFTAEVFGEDEQMGD